MENRPPECGAEDSGSSRAARASSSRRGDCLVVAGRQLAETERDRLELEVAEREAEWIGAALRDWAFVATVRVKGATGALLISTECRRRRLEGGRMTQLLDLLLLAPGLQVAALRLEAVDGGEPMSKRALRAVAHAGSWVEQRAQLRR